MKRQRGNQQLRPLSRRNELKALAHAPQNQTQVQIQIQSQRQKLQTKQKNEIIKSLQLTRNKATSNRDRYQRTISQDHLGMPMNSETERIDGGAHNTTPVGQQPPIFLPRVAQLPPKWPVPLLPNRPKTVRTNNVCSYLGVCRSDSVSASGDTRCRNMSSVTVRRLKVAQAVRLPDIQNKSFVYLCKPVKKIRDLLTPRSMEDSSDTVHNVTQVDEQVAVPLETALGQTKLDSVELFEDAMLPPEEASSKNALQQNENAMQDQAAANENLSTQQELSEKLETCMQTSNLRPNNSSVYLMPRSTKANVSFELVAITCLGFRYELELIQLEQKAHICAALRCYGFIREFRIETKTLNDLKSADDLENFYLAIGKRQQSCELRPTSYRKLKKNPNVLLKQLRPLKDSSQAAEPVTLSRLIKSEESGEDLSQLIHKHISYEFPTCSLPIAKAVPTQQFKQCEVIVNKQSKRCGLKIKRQSCADGRMMAPAASTVQSKMRRLTKTMLVGMAQVFVFVCLIMGLTYPEIHCGKL